jgi:hypothetical protein
MKQIRIKTWIIALAFMGLFTSCTSLGRTIREGNTLVQLKKEDYALSDQVSGSAKQVKILAIDWSRLFKRERSRIVTAPLLTTGGVKNLSKVESYALYNLLLNNTGYDVVFYPTFEQERIKVLFFFSKTKVTVRARLGKLNK